MDKDILAALTTSAKKAKIIDTDVITNPVFAKILEGATVENAGKIVNQMRNTKPLWFQSFDDMSDSELATAEEEILNSAPSTLEQTRERVAAMLKTIDAGRLTPDQMDVYETALTGSNTTDLGALAEIAARQKVVA